DAAQKRIEHVQGGLSVRERKPWTHFGVRAFRPHAAGLPRAFPKGRARKPECTGADLIRAGYPLARVPAACSALRDVDACAVWRAFASDECSVALRLRVGKQRKSD